MTLWWKITNYSVFMPYFVLLINWNSNRAGWDTNIRDWWLKYKTHNQISSEATVTYGPSAKWTRGLTGTFHTKLIFPTGEICDAQIGLLRIFYASNIGPWYIISKDHQHNGRFKSIVMLGQKGLHFSWIQLTIFDFLEEFKQMIYPVRFLQMSIIGRKFFLKIRFLQKVWFPGKSKDVGMERAWLLILQVLYHTLLYSIKWMCCEMMLAITNNEKIYYINHHDGLYNHYNTSIHIGIQHYYSNIHKNLHLLSSHVIMNNLNYMQNS